MISLFHFFISIDKLSLFRTFLREKLLFFLQKFPHPLHRIVVYSSEPKLLWEFFRGKMWSHLNGKYLFYNICTDVYQFQNPQILYYF